MANTTNYNWETPDDTDLVKDGAAAIRTLGSSVDTTTKALNPSTTLGDIEYRSATANTNTRLGIGSTGQVLTVAGGVPTWATSDDANAIQNAIVDAKGDLIAASAADTPARLAVGANGTVLTADSAEATGLKWAAAAGSSGPAFNAYRGTTAQTISTSTHTKVELNAEFFDTDNCFDPTTNYRFTPTKAGKYQVNVDLRIAATSGNVARHIIRIYKNGTPFTRILDDTFATDAVCHSGADLIDMNGTTDYLELYVYAVATTPTIEPMADDSKTCFSASWIRS